ncbi:effector-associated constant component EACC1 [Nocardia sp. NPDC055053]
MSYAGGFSRNEREQVMTARIRLVGDQSGSELRNLMSWLGREDEFRGRVSVEQQPIRPGEMGTWSDVLIVAVGTGGAGTVLARSIGLWITHRRPRIGIEINRGKGKSIKITGDLPAKEVTELLRKALDS